MNLKPTTQSLSYEQFTAKLEEKIKPVIEFFAGNAENFPGTGDRGVKGDVAEKYVCLVDDGEDIVTVHYENEKALKVSMIVDGKKVEQILDEKDSEEVMTYFVNQCNKLHGEKMSIIDRLDKAVLESGQPEAQAIVAFAKATAAMMTEKAKKSGKSPLAYLFETLLKD